REFLLFFITVFAVYWAMPLRKARITLLFLTGSYFLYASGKILYGAARLLSAGTGCWQDLWLFLEKSPAGSNKAYWMAGILGVVIFLAFRIGPHRARVWLLLTVSFFFYACFNKWLAFVICVSTAMDYAIARSLDGSRSQALRRALVLLSLVANLGLLV